MDKHDDEHNNKYKLTIDDEQHYFTLKSIIFHDIKKSISNQKYKDKYEVGDHYHKIITDKEYFLFAFKRLIFNEINKRKYDIKNEDEFYDLISESYIILIELYDKMQINFDTIYKDKTILDKTKVLQSYIRIAYPGRLFNWWCKWRNLKYIANPGGKGTYVKMVYEGFEPELYDYKDMGDKDMGSNDSGEDNTSNNIIKNDTNNGFIDIFLDVEEISINKINIEKFWSTVESIISGIHLIIFEMYYKYEMSYYEIMERLNISKKKVATIKWYSDQKVKEYFKIHNLFGEINER